MAEDNSARYRSDDSFGREPAAPASDPLAELARLIGRNDPHAGYSAPARPAPPVETAIHHAIEPELRYEAAPQYEPVPQYEPAPRYAADYPPPAPESPASHNEWPAPQAYAPVSAPFPPQQHYAPPVPQFGNPGYVSPPVAAPHFPSPNYPSPNVPSFQSPGVSAPSFLNPGASFPSPNFPAPNFATPNLVSQSQPGPSFPSPNYPGPAYADQRPARDSYPPDQSGFAVPGYAAAPDRQGFEPQLYPQDPDAGGMPPPHDDEFYDDEPRGNRRKGLLTVVAVLGLAVVGTAGAFGYRSVFSGTRSATPPPVIRASGEPSKVAPPPVTQDPSPGKFSYDRFGDAGKDEKVVRREEKPVDLTKAAVPPPASTVATKSTMAGNPPSAIGEPRRVRTVPIRPEQGGDVASAAPSQQPPSAAPRQINSNANASASVPDAASRVPPRAAPARPAPAAPAGNAPLSLSPDANNAPAVAVPAAAPPMRVAPPPARVAAAPVQAPPAASGGGYAVQVSSQRSEAEAESAYRGIQSKYSGVLSGQPHQVRRADLGAKGVYYRAVVGPFGSRDEAVQLCTSLKQAGGDCVVQH